MTSPIGNNQPIVNVNLGNVTQTTSTQTGAIGGHSVTTTASGQTAETASTTTTTATTTLQETAESRSTEASSSSTGGISVGDRPVSVTTTGSPQASGAAGRAEQASARSSLSFKNVSSNEGDSSKIEDAESQTDLEGAAGGRRDSIDSTHSESSLGSLHGLHASEMSEADAANQVGPGGLPEQAIPSYDPSNKASIIEFLKNPAVQGKMQTKGGHLVYVDEARSSFIFVRNGDWNQVESIKVSHGRTKQPITNPGQLEQCIARFCVGFNEMQGSWDNSALPTLSARAGGATGNYSHLVMNYKFKTAVAYGTWNAKEASGNYTPSAWRRGAELKVNKEVFGDVGPLKPVNWSQTQRPDDVEFRSETPIPVEPMPFGMPSININVNTNIDTGTVEPKVVEKKTEETVIETKVEEPGPGEDDMAPPPPPPGPPPAGGVKIPGTGDNLKDVLQNVRQHLNTVYDRNGSYHQGNQDLGTVVSTTEAGTWKPTVRLDPKPQPLPKESKAPNEGELKEVLNNIRQHLDTVYDEKGEHHAGSQDLGTVVSTTEAGTWVPTQRLEEGTSSSTEGTSGSEETSETDETSETTSQPETESVDENSDVSNDTGTQETSDTNSQATSGPDPEGGELQRVLNNVRQHLDTVYDDKGVHHTGNQDLGTVVSTTEKGTWTPTVLVEEGAGGAEETGGTEGSDTTGATTDTESISGDSDVGNDTETTSVDSDTSSVNETGSDELNVSQDTSSSSGPAKSEGTQSGSQGVRGSSDGDGAELAETLGRVRKHLDTVYPNETTSTPLEANRNLGGVIKEAEAGLPDSGTILTGSNQGSSNVNNDASSSGSGGAGAGSGSGGSDSGGAGSGGSGTSSGDSGASGSGSGGGGAAGGGESKAGGAGAVKMTGKQFNVETNERNLLKEVRSHLDSVYVGGTQGDRPQRSQESLGNVVSRFKEETGSGGIHHSETRIVENPSGNSQPVKEAPPTPKGNVKSLIDKFENKKE